MDKRVIARPNKGLAKLIYWVMKGRSTDDARPNLNYLSVLNDEHEWAGPSTVMAVDGFRAHVAIGANRPVDEQLPIPTGEDKYLHLDPGVTWEPFAKVAASPQVQEWVDRSTDNKDVKIPDLGAVVPSIRQDLEPVMTFAVNSQFLKDALDKMTKNESVVLRFFQYRDPALRDAHSLGANAPMEIVYRDPNVEDVLRAVVIMPMSVQLQGDLTDAINEKFPVRNAILTEGWAKPRRTRKLHFVRARTKGLGIMKVSACGSWEGEYGGEYTPWHLIENAEDVCCARCQGALVEEELVETDEHGNEFKRA